MPNVKGQPRRLFILRSGDWPPVEIGYLVSDPTHFEFTNPEFDDRLDEVFDSVVCDAVQNSDGDVILIEKGNSEDESGARERLQQIQRQAKGEPTP